MRYIHVSWLHDDVDEPAELYSELDGDSFEVRKLEVYRDGRIGFADTYESTGSTRLGLVPVPPLVEIAEDPEFRPEEISRAEFERLWESARAVSRAS